MTSCGTTVCPATTDAITVAIVIGEARIWPWPIMSAALVGLRRRRHDVPEVRREAEVVVDAHAERRRGVDEVVVDPSLVRSLMYAVLQEFASADAR